MDTIRDNYVISTDKAKLDVSYIHQYLCFQSYWAGNIPIDIVRQSIEGSLCFGLFDGEKQIGFARMVTDAATFAFLADVFVDEKYRGKGIGKKLIQHAIDWSLKQKIFKLRVRTQTKRLDALQFYRSLKFEEVKEQKVFQLELA